ncbi:MAG: hypothetical protein ABIX28_23825 [Vicinamibacterales bacterium]
MIRVEFDATLDELVDVNLRLAESTIAFAAGACGRRSSSADAARRR